MKKWKTLTSICLCAILIVSAFWVSKNKNTKTHSTLSKPITPQGDKRFVIIIPSYNNSAYCEENILSVLSQDYPYFRVIYIDDCSEDDTVFKVERYVNTFFPKSDFTLIKNTERKGCPSANLYYAVHSCKDDEIVVVVDGDDKLSHTHVLSKLNTTYANPNVWMTYGDFINYPTYERWNLCKKIPKKIIKNNRFRSYNWVASHLRTFYAGLFKRIKLNDLLYNGNFFPAAGDLAITFPMLEMAGDRHKFIRDILYIYNRSNPLNEDKVIGQLQQDCDSYARKLPRYKRIDSFLEKPALSHSADLMIFSFNRPLQLYALLESAERYIKNLSNIFVIYRTTDAEFDIHYDIIKKTFPKIHFIKQSLEPLADFKPLVMNTLSSSPSDYIIFAVDDMICIDDVDIHETIKILERTGAYGFYLTHSDTMDYSYMVDIHQDIPPHVAVTPNVYLWQFHQGTGDWAYPNSLDMVLYRKNQVIKTLSKLSFMHPNSMEAQWHGKAKLKDAGLFYTSAKAVNIPLNLVNISTNRCLHTISAEELLRKFQEGYKIDITPLSRIPHNARHIDYEPQFVLR